MKLTFFQPGANYCQCLGDQSLAGRSTATVDRLQRVERKFGTQSMGTRGYYRANDDISEPARRVVLVTGQY